MLFVHFYNVETVNWVHFGLGFGNVQTCEFALVLQELFDLLLYIHDVRLLVFMDFHDLQRLRQKLQVTCIKAAAYIYQAVEFVFVCK